MWWVIHWGSSWGVVAKGRMWVARKPQELGPPSSFLLRKLFSIRGRERNNARMILTCPSLPFFFIKAKRITVAISTYYLEHISAATVARHQGINVQVCNLNHKCDKHPFKWGDHMDPGNPCSAGIWRISRSWKPLSISSMVLPFHFLLSALDVRKAVCLMESSATKQPPSG